MLIVCICQHCHSIILIQVRFEELMICTLKALALTPLVLRRLLLALKAVSLAGSIGSLTSLFSARDNSSSRLNLENAPSSISEIKFPVRSILFSVTVIDWGESPCSYSLLLVILVVILSFLHKHDSV